MVQAVAQARSLERQIAVLRWFVAAFGAVQVGFALRDVGQDPRHAVPLGIGLVVALALGNLVVGVVLDQGPTPTLMRVTGIAAFALDTVVLTALVWLASDGPADPVWVIAYLVPLEGAARWGLGGALIGAGLFAAGQIGGELWALDAAPGSSAGAPVLAFRITMAFVVAAVAGGFASSLRRQAALAESRAGEAEEARARAEESAERERQARGEVAAFHAAVLATPTDEQIGRSLQHTAEAMAVELGCEALGLLLREEGMAGETVFAAVGVHGDPGYLVGERLYAATDHVAEAAEAGKPTHVGPDVIAPMRVRGEVIGAIHERGPTRAAADPERLTLLSRLADQLGLVLESARLRADQEATVERLRELDEMKRDFVAVTSHELRTPLSGIRGFVDMLRRRGDDVPQAEREDYLDIVLSQTDRLISLVDDLLVVSRVEAGKLSLEPEETEIAPFCDRLIRSFGGDAVRLEVAPSPGAPATMIVDPRRLAQVLTNLVHNALKFAPGDTAVTVAWEAPAEGIVRFHVIDRGPGIPPEDLDLIWERFHQAESSSTHAEGFGLGLYITKRLAEAMGGWVDVSSTPGSGTTFSITLPEQRPMPLPSRSRERVADKAS